jgi:hypothetical protein
MLLDKSSLDIVKKYHQIQQNFYSLKGTNRGLEKIYSECYKNPSDQIGYLRLLKPQSYGALMERLHLRHHEDYINKVPSHRDQGDYKNKHNRYWEYKFSMVNSDGKINFVQLRPWQVVDYVLEVLHLDNRLETYCIPHTSMVHLIAQHGGNAHGTKKSNQFNDKVEKALRPRCSPPNECWKDMQRFKISQAELHNHYKIASAE